MFLYNICFIWGIC